MTINDLSLLIDHLFISGAIAGVAELPVNERAK